MNPKKQSLLDQFNSGFKELEALKNDPTKIEMPFLKTIEIEFGLNKEEAIALLVIFQLESKQLGINTLEEISTNVLGFLSEESNLSSVLHTLAERALIKSQQGLINRKDFGLSNWLTKAIFKNDLESINKNLPKGLVNAALMVIDTLYFDRNSIDLERIERANLRLFPLFASIRNVTRSELEMEILFSIVCFELSKQPFNIGMVCKLNAPITWIERTKEELANGNHYLLKEGYISTTNNQFSMLGEEEKIPLRLTDKSKNQFLFPFLSKEEKAIFTKASMELVEKTSFIETIKNKDIPPQALFYNDDLQNEIEIIKKVVQPDGFSQFQKVISKNSRKKGLTMIFSGPPGTGKTSLAHHLAQISNRDLIPLDVSQLLSKWVGETEQNMKRLFEYYDSLTFEKPNFPILLIDEGDALLHKRLKETQSSVDLMNNHMTSAILKALDTFSGILIITTNSFESFDPAFLRRFLFKLEMPIPQVNTRKELIRNYFPELNDNERLIAEMVEHPLSGSDLENLKILYEVYANFGQPTLDKSLFFHNYVKSKPQHKKLGF